MMKSLFSSLRVALVLFPLVASAQSRPGPVIRSIDPTSGPTTGGTVVTVTGENLAPPPSFACVAPCPPQVSFDGIKVDAQFATDTVYVVRTPAHAPGVVDVAVHTPDGRTTAVQRAFSYVSGQEASYERLLLPIYLDGVVAGANGSRFRTDFWLRNNGDALLTLAPWPCPDGGACPAIFPLTHAVAPGETIHNLPPFFSVPRTNPSRVLFASRNAVSRTSMNLRIFDESRGRVDAGAEVPVVREGDLLTSPAQLHSVPLRGDFRLMLRVYELALTSARFRVRVFEEFPGTGSAQPISEFELTATTNQTGDFRSEAAYADYAALTDLLRSPLPRPEFLRIQVEPLTQGSRYWTFLSVTSNDTQRVTLITP
jgi:hypothetical protein